MVEYEEEFRKEQREAGDCVVLSVASVCGVSYPTAHHACFASGRAAQLGTHRDITEAALDFLGWEIAKVWTVRELALETIVPDPHLADLEGKDWLPRMLVSVNDGDHVAPFFDGQVRDWSRNTEAVIDEAWEVRKRGVPVRSKLPPVIYL